MTDFNIKPGVAFIALVITLLVPLCSVYAAMGVRIGVEKELGCEPRFFNLNTTGGYAEAKMEVFNSGTVGYKTTARLDIMSNGVIFFSSWGRPSIVLPGERAPYRLSWFGTNKENITAKARVYCGTEVVETDVVDASIDSSITPEDVFHISNIRTYEDKLKFRLVSDKDASEVAVFISDYIPGWLFEQARIYNVSTGKPVYITIPYETGVFQENTISINLVGNRGEYFTKSAYDMKMEAGVLKYWNMLMDWLGSIF